MDWTSSDRKDDFRFVQVSQTDFSEIGLVGSIGVGGLVEYNMLSELKVSGSVPFVGGFDVGNNYLRIYLDATIGSIKQTVALGTFDVAAPSLTLSDKARSGSVDLISLLKRLADRRVYETYGIQAGADLIDSATNLVKTCGLWVSTTPSAAKAQVAHLWSSGTSYLEIINDLLELAGYGSASVDGMGTVVFDPYRDPATLSPSIELVASDRSVFAPEVDYEFDFYDVPNVVVAVLTNQDETKSATARNDNPQSRYSTVARGREIAEVVSVSEAADTKELLAVAQRELANKTSAVESIEITHSYMPFDMGQAVSVSYPAANLTFVGSAVKQSLTLAPGGISKTRLRRFVRF